MKGKERVPVPVAGPAFRGGVKFVIFYVFSSFLQPAAQIDPVQCSFPPVRNSSLDREEETRVSEEQRVEVTKQLQCDLSSDRLVGGFKIFNTTMTVCKMERNEDGNLIF